MKNLVQSAKHILPEWVLVRLRTWRRKTRRIWTLATYAGDNVECPLCGMTFCRFAPTGVLERAFWMSDTGRQLLGLDFIAVPQKMCPGCGSSERHRLQYLYLRDRLNIADQRDISLLDVAPDNFLQEKIFFKLPLFYISIDISASRRPNCITDLTRLAFRDCQFDAIICSHVLEHIRDDQGAMRELFRVLKPGGWALLQVPIWAETTVEDPDAPESEYVNLYGHSGHVRRYGMDYADRLRKAGFVVELDHFASDLSPEQRKRYGIDPAEIVFLCRRLPFGPGPNSPESGITTGTEHRPVE